MTTKYIVCLTKKVIYYSFNAVGILNFYWKGDRSIFVMFNLRT